MMKNMCFIAFNVRGGKIRHPAFGSMNRVPSRLRIISRSACLLPVITLVAFLVVFLANFSLDSDLLGNSKNLLLSHQVG